jgi:hypothetical protein
MLASHSDGRAQRSAWDASRASAIQDSASKIMRSVGWPALTSIKVGCSYAVIVRRLKRSTATPEDQGGSPLIERPDLGCVLKKLVMSVISAVRTITLASGDEIAGTWHMGEDPRRRADAASSTICCRGASATTSPSWPIRRSNRAESCATPRSRPLPPGTPASHRPKSHWRGCCVRTACARSRGQASRRMSATHKQPLAMH